MSGSLYILQPAEKTFCPNCRRPVMLLCYRPGEMSGRHPAFYICFACQTVGEAGKGPVEREQANG
jgi:hypothetical protein